MELTDIMRHRRSVRSYTNQPLSEDELKTILEAGLLSPSGRNIKPCEFIVVTDKSMLLTLAGARTGAADMLKNAAAAIAVISDESRTDTYIEDASIAMSNMHLMADSLGLGSCWIQGRGRESSDGSTTEEYVRSLLHFPENMRLIAILSLGHTESHPDSRGLTESDLEKVHYSQY